MSIPELKVFHLGIVVRDREAAIETLRRTLGIDNWKTRILRPEVPIKVAYGGDAKGHPAYELIEVPPEGKTKFHIFLKEHGEGIEHIGIWTPDLKATLRAALDAGGRLVDSQADHHGTVTTIEPGKEDLDSFNRVGFIGPVGLGVLFEFCGPPLEGGLKEWLGDQYDQIVPSAPWA